MSFDLDEEQEELDFIPEHKKIYVNLKVNVDAVDRVQVLRLFATHDGKHLYKAIQELQPVTLTLKTGFWTYICNDSANGLKVVECSACQKRAYDSTIYCPNCGALMLTNLTDK